MPPLFQVPFPIPPITPGGVGNAPGTLPPFPGGGPPVLVLPPNLTPEVVPEPKKEDKKPPIVPEPKKEDKKPEPNKNEGNKLVVPPLTIPAPPGLNPDLPLLPPPPGVGFPPAPVEKGPSLPVVPVGTGKQTGPSLTPASTAPLPILPSIDPVDPSRPDLPAIPRVPTSGQK